MSTNKTVAYAAAGALCLSLGACTGGNINSQYSTAIGVLAGGVLGSGLTAGSIVGTAAGAAVGGVIGYHVGKRL